MITDCSNTVVLIEPGREVQLTSLTNPTMTDVLTLDTYCLTWLQTHVMVDIWTPQGKFGVGGSYISLINHLSKEKLIKGSGIEEGLEGVAIYMTKQIFVTMIYMFTNYSQTHAERIYEENIAPLFHAPA